MQLLVMRDDFEQDKKLSYDLVQTLYLDDSQVSDDDF
jgi:hypothetical protein